MTGTLTINSNTATIPITVADSTSLVGKSFTIALNNGQSSITGIIDYAYYLSATSVLPLSSIDETAGANAVTFTLTSNAPDSTVVGFVMTGTATQDSDYTLSSDHFVIFGGEGTITLTPIADGTTEGDETVTMTCKNESQTITINDNSLTMLRYDGTWLFDGSHTFSGS